jgi:hypothetical protein
VEHEKGGGREEGWDGLRERGMDPDAERETSVWMRGLEHIYL